MTTNGSLEAHGYKFLIVNRDLCIKTLLFIRILHGNCMLHLSYWILEKKKNQCFDLLRTYRELVCFGAHAKMEKQTSSGEIILYEVRLTELSPKSARNELKVKAPSMLMSSAQSHFLCLFCL